MIVASLFSGVGGLDLGLARAGLDVACFAEIDPWRRRILQAHWPDVYAYPDVRHVQATDFSTPPDLLAGGFPCQDLSVASNARRGLAGPRSSLFHEFARVADAVRPAWLLIENVPGLLSSHDGRDFGVVVGTLADLGYGVAWRVLDARHFGVAQRRRRVFVVGRLGDDGSSALRALCESCPGGADPIRCSWQTAPAAAPRSAAGSRELVAGCASELDIAASLMSLTGSPRSTDIDAATWVAVHGTQDPIHAVGYTPPLDNDARIFVSPSRRLVRRLTPVECERLMGWPDGWTAPTRVPAADTARYAACGDGVVANVAEWIGRRIAAEAAA